MNEITLDDVRLVFPEVTALYRLPFGRRGQYALTIAPPSPEVTALTAGPVGGAIKKVALDLIPYECRGQRIWGAMHEGVFYWSR